MKKDQRNVYIKLYLCSYEGTKVPFQLLPSYLRTFFRGLSVRHLFALFVAVLLQLVSYDANSSTPMRATEDDVVWRRTAY